MIRFTANTIHVKPDLCILGICHRKYLPTIFLLPLKRKKTEKKIQFLPKKFISKSILWKNIQAIRRLKAIETDKIGIFNPQFDCKQMILSLNKFLFCE